MKIPKDKSGCGCPYYLLITPRVRGSTNLVGSGDASTATDTTTAATTSSFINMIGGMVTEHTAYTLLIQGPILLGCDD